MVVDKLPPQARASLSIFRSAAYASLFREFQRGVQHAAATSGSTTTTVSLSTASLPNPSLPTQISVRKRARGAKSPQDRGTVALTGSAPAPIRTLTRSSTRTTSSSVVSMAFTSSCTRSFARWPSDVRHLRNRWYERDRYKSASLDGWSARATFIRIHSLIHPNIAASLLSISTPIQSSLSLSLSQASLLTDPWQSVQRESSFVVAHWSTHWHRYQHHHEKKQREIVNASE